MQISKKPTHAAVSRFMETLLPLKENDVPRLYHVPRNTRYDSETAVVDQIVLSVTPTPGVYSFIGYTPDNATLDPSVRPSPTRTRDPRTLCFLHRPFTLDRRSVRRGTLVLSSHNSFDEVLTTGWNPSLAARLQINVDDSEEFGEAELAFDGLSDEIRAVAVMNAFNDHEVKRVLEVALQHGWAMANDEAPGKHILYLTGQPRVNGMEAAKALGMTVVCVGHRPAEDWGIRYMAAQLRTKFPTAMVHEVYEEEELRVKEPKISEEG
ncbi:hypothetical protein SNOG_00970 [Parastagonospora nodorum SN15]|uniref:Uncharacterized protein n=1 Tax=Phaeosphaeria nodorum (strain SN15 / ATCC MYA-4574 / FGSC 10173) TaxID=321614 RepID=Q0V4U4_PHANO|nr:hypothetical protein SNOG_00970 [Parastagonospora nodorum SN15]EAT92465.1 hypothetical protein SNOG_00970 [Parastagonospora nodorum SN15]